MGRSMGVAVGGLGCVCEYLPRMAGIMDRVIVVRSLTHPHPEHSVSFSLTDIPKAQFDLDARSPRHAPFIGSVVANALTSRFETRRQAY
jgi:hypothetical protein